MIFTQIDKRKREVLMKPPCMLKALAWAILILFASCCLPGLGSVSAQSPQDKRFEDYWKPGGFDDSSSQGETVGGAPTGIFLKTREPWVKMGVFAALALILYFAWWRVFKILLNPGRSPLVLFRYTFMGYMVSLYGAVFVCFSEYALAQAYDPKLFYLSQLHWMTLIISLGVWAILSFITTYILEGQSS